MSEEKRMVSQESVTATSADAGSIMPLAADLSRTQDVTTVSEVSTINSTDQFYMNQSGKFVQVDYSKLADAILGKISSKTYSLDQGTKTLIAAINELNSKTNIYVDSVSGFQSIFNKLTTLRCYPIQCDGAFMGEISNGKITSSGRGVASKNSGGTCDLMLLVIESPSTIYSFRINLSDGQTSYFCSFEGENFSI